MLCRLMLCYVIIFANVLYWNVALHFHVMMHNYYRVCMYVCTYVCMYLLSACVPTYLPTCVATYRHTDVVFGPRMKFTSKLMELRGDDRTQLYKPSSFKVRVLSFQVKTCLGFSASRLSGFRLLDLKALRCRVKGWSGLRCPLFLPLCPSCM